MKKKPESVADVRTALEDMVNRWDSAHPRQRLFHCAPVIAAAREALRAQPTPPAGAEEKVCFWPSGCSDSERCRAAGACVARLQNEEITRRRTLAKESAPSEAAKELVQKIIDSIPTSILGLWGRIEVDEWVNRLVKILAAEKRFTPVSDATKPSRQDLWKFFADVHGLSLLESELNDIVIQCSDARFEEWAERAKGLEAELERLREKYDRHREKLLEGLDEKDKEICALRARAEKTEAELKQERASNQVVIEDFVDRLLGALNQRGVNTSDWDGDDAPEIILANRITAALSAQQAAEQEVERMTRQMDGARKDFARIGQINDAEDKGVVIAQGRKDIIRDICNRWPSEQALAQGKESK